MRTRDKALTIGMTMLLLLPAWPLHAANVTVDCNKKSLASEIGKLDKNLINTVNITGNCVGDLLIFEHANLTLSGSAGASLTGGTPNGTALTIDGSRVTMQNLLVNAGGANGNGVSCTNRSVCVLRNVGVAGALTGIGAQTQSAIDIIGSSYVQGSSAPFGIGVGVFGASSVNIHPTWPNGFDPGEAGPSITQNETGIVAQDGSFLRTDNVLISGNRDGVLALRNATIKILGNTGGVVNNTGTGISAIYNSVAQVGTPVTGNLGFGVEAGPLSYVRIQGGAGSISGNGANINCWGPYPYLHGNSYGCP